MLGSIDDEGQSLIDEIVDIVAVIEMKIGYILFELVPQVDNRILLIQV